MNKTIIIVTGSMVKGGAEGVIAQVSNGLAEHGWHIVIIGLLLDKLEYSLHPNDSFISLARGKRSTTFSSLRLIKDLRKEIKRIDPCVVVSFMAKMNIITYFALMGTGRRFIASERNDPSVGRGAVYRYLLNKAYAATESVVFQTTKAKNYFSKTIQEKGVIIPNPVSPMPEAVANPLNKIVAVGRLTKQKNHKLLIDVFERVSERYPDFILEIYGDGELRPQIEDYIKSRKLENKIILKGMVPNVPDKIKDAYMFVHTSDYEGFSNAILEAMAIGLPCVTTNCAGCDDAIQDGVNGLLVPVGDRDSFVEAMLKLLGDREYARSIGLAARKSTGRYQAFEILKQWESVIDK